VAGLPTIPTDNPLGRGASLGEKTAEDTDIALLAKGGRTNVFGFLLRLAARLPFLFIAGRFMARTRSADSPMRS